MAKDCSTDLIARTGRFIAIMTILQGNRINKHKWKWENNDDKLNVYHAGVISTDVIKESRKCYNVLKLALTGNMMLYMKKK